MQQTSILDLFIAPAARRRAGLSLVAASAFLVTALPGFAQTGTTTGDPTGAPAGNDVPSFHRISPEAMDAIKAWGDRRTSIEGQALTQFPEAIEAYGDRLTGYYGSFARHLENTYPQSALAFLEDTGRDPYESDQDLVGYLMANRQDDWLRLQAEPGLERARLTFAQFAEDSFPLLIAEVSRINSSTPAASGIGLDQYLWDNGQDGIVDELGGLTLQGQTDDSCSCWMLVEDFTQSKTGNTSPDSGYQNLGGFPNKIREWDYDPQIDGAEKDIYYHRRSRWNTFTKKYEVRSESNVEVKLHCTQGPEATGKACVFGSCQGKVDAKIEYASQVWQKVRSAGVKVIGNNGYVDAADTAAVHLRVDGQLVTNNSYAEKGAGGRLFTNNKKATHQEIGTELVGPVVDLIAEMIETNDFWGGLVNWLVSGDAVGAVKFMVDGDEPGFQVKEEHEEDGPWLTKAEGSFPVQPHKTYTVTLDTHTVLAGSGFGDSNYSKATVDTAFYIAMAHGDYTCAAGAVAPPEGAVWMWGAAPNAPYTASQVKSKVESYLESALDQSLQSGHFDQKEGGLTLN